MRKDFYIQNQQFYCKSSRHGFALFCVYPWGNEYICHIESIDEAKRIAREYIGA